MPSVRPTAVGFQYETRSPFLVFDKELETVPLLIRVGPSPAGGTTRTVNWKIVARGDPGNNCDIPACCLSVCLSVALPSALRNHDCSLCKLFGLRVFFCLFLIAFSGVCLHVDIFVHVQASTRCVYCTMKVDEV